MSKAYEGDLLKAILDHIPVGVTLMDGGLRFLVINRTAIDILGLPPEMFDGRMPTFGEVARFNAERGEYGPGDVEKLVAERLEKARNPAPHHFQRTRPDGTTIEIHGVPLPNGGFVTIYADITARKVAEDALRQQSLYLRTVLEHLPQGISVFDRQLRLKCWNSMFLDVLELPPESVYLDVPFEDLIMYPARRGEYGPGDPAQLVATRRNLAAQFLPHRFERTRPNGRTHLIEGRPMLLDGMIVGFVTSYTDITDRKRSEEVLRGQTVLLQALLENIPGGVSVFDKDLSLVLYNDEVIRLLGIPKEFVAAGASFESLIRLNAERGDYGAVDVNDTVSRMTALARHPTRHVVERIRPDGTAIEIRGAPMPDGGFVSIYTDVTARRNMEDSLRRQTVYLKAVLDQLPQGVSVFDENLRLKHWNDKLLDILGLPSEVVVPDVRFEDLIRFPAQRGEYGPGDIEEQIRIRRELASRFLPHRFERSRPNGRTNLVEGNPMMMDGQLVGFITTYTDITEHKQAEESLRQRNEIFQTLINNIPGGVTLFDGDLRLVAWNQEFQRLLDFPDELFENGPTLERFFRYNIARGEYVREADGLDDEQKVAELMRQVCLRQPHVFERTRPNGVILEIRGLPLPGGGFVTIYTDVTERRRAAEAIHRLAHQDSLTGLANRYTLEARLDQSIADARRHGHHLALLFVDMDYFKSINDTLGHAVGDLFLLETARRLQASVRENDIVARMGGDEFVIVINEVHDSAEIAAVAGKIVAAIAQPIIIGTNRLASSASIGISAFPENGDDRNSLLKSADIAMYHAKAAGRGVYRFFDNAMMVAATARLEMEAALREAIARSELVLHFQPLLQGAGAGEKTVLTGFEALVRWQKSDGTLVPPASFIPLAESCGLIVAIGEYVLRSACRTVQGWRQEGAAALRVSVNISVRELVNPDFSRIVAQALAESGLPPDCLELEVTESAAMQDPEVSIANLQKLKALGIGIAIDDFGTGYSSLAYLKLLPIDRIKLDRTFVKDLEIDANDAAICAATIGLAHNLGLKIVAEGVETAAQLEYLTQLGCDEVQGFHFSRPLPAGEALAYLRALGD